MSEDAAELERIAARLGELAAALDSEQVDDEQAVELAREAGELSARAGSVLSEALRAGAESSEAGPTEA